MRQAANLHHFPLRMLQPGIKLNTSPTDFVAITSGKNECASFIGLWSERFRGFGVMRGC